MATSRSCIAIKACLLLSLLGPVVAAHAAAAAGTVAEVDGRLLVKNASGAIKVLAPGSSVQAGDLLASKKATYASVKLAGRGSITLQPDTLLTIEQYTFDPARPQQRTVVLRLVSGGVRVASGSSGKDGKDAFTLITPLGSIDVAGATAIVEYVAPVPTGVASIGSPWPARVPVLLALNDSTVRSDAVSFSIPAYAAMPLELAQNTVPSDAAGRNPGLYVQVLDGAINLTNAGGTQNFTAGQFGFTPNLTQPPVILPTNPGMQFTPPPSFSSTTGSAGGSGSAKPGDVNCQVR